MHIIIDGYNFLRQSDSLRRFERISLEEGRMALIRLVYEYKKMKGQKVTIVFDGWEGGSPLEERDLSGGMEIIYSRRGEKADEVIKRLAQKRDEEILVVTSDRSIVDFVTHRGVSAISSPEFEAVIARASGAMPADKDDDRAREEERESAKKKGPSRRLSRKERDKLATLRKL